LADSDDSRTWPVADRRTSGNRRSGRDRRAGTDRRSQAVAELQGERRTTPDRRAGDRRSGDDRRSEADWNAVPLELSATGSVESEHALLAAAIDARQHAHARYSGFKVGAALETPEGQIVSGCNIENATYGLTLCAERVALVKALSEGVGVFTRIAVVADTESPTPPCGPCRQLLWEYCGDIDIILGNLTGPTGRYRLSALLPLPFDARFLDK
jgi:cytidine deaminase